MKLARAWSATVLGPLIDLLGYFAAIGVGAGSVRSQAISFILATAFYYAPHAISEMRARARTWNSTLLLHLVAVTLLVFFCVAACSHC